MFTLFLHYLRRGYRPRIAFKLARLRNKEIRK